jgi:hypothetical protein
MPQCAEDQPGRIGYAWRLFRRPGLSPLPKVWTPPGLRIRNVHGGQHLRAHYHESRQGDRRRSSQDASGRSARAVARAPRLASKASTRTGPPGGRNGAAPGNPGVFPAAPGRRESSQAADRDVCARFTREVLTCSRSRAAPLIAFAMRIPAASIPTEAESGLGEPQPRARASIASCSMAARATATAPFTSATSSSPGTCPSFLRPAASEG